MRKFYKITFGLLLAALFFEVLVGFPIHLDLTPENQKQPTTDLSQFSGAPQKMQGVHLVESVKGERDWELFAEKAEGYEGQGAWELKNVKVLFYSHDVVNFTVIGKSGRIDTKSKDIRIEGDVRTSSSNGYQFFSNKVEYQSAHRKIISPDKIRMIGPGDSKGKGLAVNGNNMETQIDNGVIKINDNVSAHKALLDGKNFIIKSGSVEFSDRSKTAKFLDKVSIQVDSLKMEGPEAQFEYLNGAEFLNSIMVRGGVRVTDLDKFATAEQVKFEPNENKLIFNGKPRVVQNNDEIVGDQIIFIDGGKRVKVENIKAKVDSP